MFHYAYDKYGNLIKATDALKNVTRFSYNQFAKPLLVNNPDGSTVKFSYDAKGNLVERIDPLERLWQFSYNASGWPASVKLPDGSVNEYTYDARGNISSFTDAAGAKISYECNKLNQVVKCVNAEGHVTLFTYNQRGDIIKSTNAMGNNCVFEYNTSGNLISAVDYCGSETKLAYNKIGKVECVIDALGYTTQYSYDLMGNVSTYIDQEGTITKYGYDLNNRLVAVTEAEGSVVCFEHDPNGNIITVKAPGGARTTIEYDALNRAIRQREPDGAEINYKYDCFGRLTSTIYPSGAKEMREYDKAGQLAAITSISGETTRYKYSLLGQLEKIINHKGDEIRYDYYLGGKLKSVVKPEGETNRYEWDKNGNMVKRTDSLGNVTKYEYDALDRVIAINNAMGGKKTLLYDPMGRVTSMTDINANTVKYRYSSLGTLLEVIDAYGHSTHYSYDAARRLTRVEQARIIDADYGDVVDAGKQLTTYEYNKSGKVMAVHDALGNTRHYTYDANGRVASMQDEDGFESTYMYNEIGQINQTSYADGKQVKYRYGEMRQLTEIQDWLGVTKIESTSAGQVTQVTRPDGKAFGYEWTELGQRKKIIYPDGSEVAYEYNGSGRLTQVKAPSGVTRYCYNKSGCLQSRELPGDISTEYGLDSFGRVIQLIHKQKDEILDDIHYQHDMAGNVIQIEKYRAGIHVDNGVFKYSYDRLNRLIEATHGEQCRKYAYDSAGNRTMVTDADSKTRYTYNSLNQLIALQDELGNKEYQYDRRGNLSKVLQNGNAETQYTYNAASLLVKAVNAQNGVIEFGYDGLCNRISKNVQLQNPEAKLNCSLQNPTEAVQYFVDILKPYNNLMGMETNGSHIQNFIWGKELIASEGDSAYTYLQDHLGSPIRLVDDDANSTHLAFDEFGVPLLTEGRNMHNPFGFTGYQADEVSGLYYAQARYYSPTTSQMVAADSWSGRGRLPQTQNKYAYCLNNPVSLVDRTGKWAMPSFTDIINVVDNVAKGFAGFMDSIADDVIDFAKETLTPYIDAANDFLGSVEEKIGEVTRPFVRYLTYAWGEVVGHENLAQWGASALNMKKDENGIYYADFNCWQRRFGYNDIYDRVFNLGTSMEKDKFKFEMPDGTEYIFWAWKGDYLNLGAGSELGIYQRYSKDHWDVNQDLAMPMTMRLLDIKGEQIFGRYPQDPQWWVTGFNSQELLKDAKELIAIYSISMGGANSDMFLAFYAENFNSLSGKAKDARLTLNPFIQMVTFTFMPKGMENACIC